MDHAVDGRKDIEWIDGAAPWMPMRVRSRSDLIDPPHSAASLASKCSQSFSILRHIRGVRTGMASADCHDRESQYSEPWPYPCGEDEHRNHRRNGSHLAWPHEAH